jgi:hypothetical protein
MATFFVVALVDSWGLLAKLVGPNEFPAPAQRLC